MSLMVVLFRLTWLFVWLASTPLIVTLIVMISLSVVSMILTPLFLLFCAATSTLFDCVVNRRSPCPFDVSRESSAMLSSGYLV